MEVPSCTCRKWRRVLAHLAAEPTQRVRQVRGVFKKCVPSDFGILICTDPRAEATGRFAFGRALGGWDDKVGWGLADFDGDGCITRRGKEGGSTDGTGRRGRVVTQVESSWISKRGRYGGSQYAGLCSGDKGAGRERLRYVRGVA